MVERTGAWFSYGDVRLGQGRENAKQFLRDNPDLFAELRQAVLVKRGYASPAQPPSEQTPPKQETKKKRK